MVYRIDLFESIAAMNDAEISDNPFADIHVFGDFKVHQKEWLSSF